MVVYDQVSQNTFKTWVYLGIFSALVVGLGWFFSYYYDAPVILALAVVFSVISAISSYWFSDRIVLYLNGARQIAEKKDFPELYRIVENLAITAGLPMPRIYVVSDPQPNAFATGRDKNHAVVAVTSGLLEILDKTELEGVLAHELSHIGNRDILLSALVTVLVGVIGMLSNWFIRLSWWGGSGRDEDEGRSGQLMFLLGVVGMILAPLVATVMQLAISRKREFLADADGVLLTRYPAGLISALEKISQAPYKSRYAKPTTAHLYFSNPFKADVGQGRKTPWVVKIFSTHPPVEERIAALKKM